MDEKKDDRGSGLWQQFLREALEGGKGAKKEGHVVVLGDPNSGKTSLISQFQKLESKAGEMKRFLMMRYAYLYLTEANTDETRALLNIWQVSEPSHAKILDVVIPKEHMENVSYLICLDASKPSTIQDRYNEWMNVLEKTQTRLLSRLDAQTQIKLKDKLQNLITFYQNPNDADADPYTEEEKENVTKTIDETQDEFDDSKDDKKETKNNNDDDDNNNEEKKDNLNDASKTKVPLKLTKIETNLGCPIIIVATKCDAFRKHYIAESEADDHFEIALSYIRWWSLKYGSSCFTMARGMKEQARRILQYLDHRVFDSQFNRGPNAVVKLSDLSQKFLFIPSGFDTKDTITTQHPNRSMEDPIEKFFPAKKNNQTEADETVHQKSQEDNVFLRTIEFELRRLDSSGKGGGGKQQQQSQQAQQQQQGGDQGNAAVQKFFGALLKKDTSVSTTSQV